MKLWKKVLVITLALLFCFSIFAGCTPDTPTHTHSDANGDGYCDECGELIDSHTHADADGDGKCDECGADMGGGVTPEGTLTVWITSPMVENYQTALRENPENRAALTMKTIVEKFKEKYPKVTLKFLAKAWGDGLIQAIMTAASTQSLPDIISSEYDVIRLAKMDIFQEVPLNPTYTNLLVEQAMGDVMYDKDGDGVKELYGVPIWTGNMALNLNTALLQKHNINDPDTGTTWIPDTWSDLLEASRLLASKSGDAAVGGFIMNTAPGVAGAFRMLQFMRQNGGSFTDGNGNVTFNSEANVKTFEFVRQLLGNQTAIGSAQVAASSAQWAINDETAFYTAWGNNAAGYSIDLAAGSITDYPHYTLPTPDGEYAYSGYTGGRSNVSVGQVNLSITRDCKNVEAATAFIEACLDPDAQKGWWIHEARIPTIKTVLEGLTTDPNPDVSSKATIAKAHLDALAYDNYNAGLPTDVDKNYAEFWQKFDTFMNDLLKTNTSVASLVATCHDAMAATQA